MIRKLAIAAIPVFVRPQPTGSLQGVLAEIVFVFYIFVISYLKPFGAAEDNLLQVGSMLGESFFRTLNDSDPGHLVLCALTNNHSSHDWEALLQSCAWRLQYPCKSFDDLHTMPGAM